MTTETQTTSGGGAEPSGPPDTRPPTKPKRDETPVKLLLSAQDVAALSGRHHESVLLALRRGVLKGTQASAKATWQIKRAAFEDWIDRGAPTGRTA